MAGDYEIPVFNSRADTVLGWALEAVSEGEAWLKVQRPTTEWTAVLETLGAANPANDASGLSSTGYNKTKRIARELVASLSNFRHEGEFKPTWDKTLYDKAHTLSDLDRNWYRQTFADESHRAVLQHGVAKGTGYLVERWDKHFHGPYRGDIKLEAYDPGDITFVQLPRDHDIQRAYATIIREELPINLARAIYGQTNPSFAANLRPDRSSPGWLQKGLQKVQKFISPALRVGGRAQEQQTASFPTVDIFHMYVMDRSINERGGQMTMGAMGTNWSYEVPGLGDPMPTGVVNPATNQYFTRPATEEDCLLFPLRRLVIFSRTGLCYDGSSPWWHGATPVSRIRFNDWAWEALGQSLVGDVRTMQAGIVELMRGIEDSAAARLNPPRLYNDQLVTKGFAEAFNTRLAGVSASANLDAGDVIKFPVPVQHYDVGNWMPEWIKSQEDRMDYLTGVRDLVAVAKARQIPGADTLEKLLEMAGPIVQDLVRRLERPLWECGEWRKAYYFQFYTSARMIQTTGPEGVEVDAQYLPEKLFGQPVPGEALATTHARTRRMISDYRYHITESGLNEIHRMSTRLFYLQLMKSGFPISWWDMAQVAKIPNFGPEPEGTNNVMERWIAQKRVEIDLAEELGATQVAPPGRPPSNAKPGRLVQKAGGTRSTVATS